MKRFGDFLTGSLLSVMFLSCSSDDDEPVTSNAPTWRSVSLNTLNQVPGITARSETGTLLYVVVGNTLYYEIEVDNLSSADMLTDAHFHAGDPLTNGPIVQGFAPTFSDGKAEGSISLRQSLADSLKNSANQLYFNIHSTNYPNGLVRGQVNSNVFMAADFMLSGDNLNPPVSTTATGTAMFRMTANNVLYTHLLVRDLDVTDELQTAHIRMGDIDMNGDVLVDLCLMPTDFGVVKSHFLSSEVMDSIQNQPVYVSVHSSAYPDGLLRSQLEGSFDGRALTSFVTKPLPANSTPSDPLPY